MMAVTFRMTPSADSALEVLGRHPVDLVITDYAMPKVTGLVLAQEIEARYPGLPVVLATGFAELPPGRGESLARLAKPYSQAELAQVLETVRPGVAAPVWLRVQRKVFRGGSRGVLG